MVEIGDRVVVGRTIEVDEAELVRLENLLSHLGKIDTLVVPLENGSKVFIPSGLVQQALVIVAVVEG